MAKEAAKKNYVINQKKDGKWVIKKDGARCATAVCATRAEAEAAAGDLAKAEGVEVVVAES